MIIELLAALAGALVVTGILLGIAGIRRTLVQPPRIRRPSRLTSRIRAMSRLSKILLAAGLAAGIVTAALTGWVIAIVLIPAAAVGLPILLSAPPGTAQIDKLDALEEWTRALAGILTVGFGLEEALRATLRSTPDAIRPEVTTLVSRLRARVGTEEALRQFADDLADETGDRVAAYLILGARRRGQGLAKVLESLAETVSMDVSSRRRIEAERRRPRTVARVVTGVTVVVLVVMTFTGDYVAPYGTPIGQLILATLLTAYVMVLLWLRRMATPKPFPRFLGAQVRQEARA